MRKRKTAQLEEELVAPAVFQEGERAFDMAMHEHCIVIKFNEDDGTYSVKYEDGSSQVVPGDNLAKPEDVADLVEEMSAKRSDATIASIRRHLVRIADSLDRQGHYSLANEVSETLKKI